MTPDQKTALCALLDAGVRPCDATRQLGLSRSAVSSFAWRRRNPSYRPGDPTNTIRSQRAYPFSTSVDLDLAMLTAIDARAKADGSSRAEAIRTLIEWGLESADG